MSSPIFRDDDPKWRTCCCHARKVVKAAGITYLTLGVLSAVAFAVTLALFGLFGSFAYIALGSALIRVCRNENVCTLKKCENGLWFILILSIVGAGIVTYGALAYGFAATDDSAEVERQQAIDAIKFDIAVSGPFQNYETDYTRGSFVNDAELMQMLKDTGSWIDYIDDYVPEETTPHSSEHTATQPSYSDEWTSVSQTEIDEMLNDVIMRMQANRERELDDIRQFHQSDNTGKATDAALGAGGLTAEEVENDAIMRMQATRETDLEKIVQFYQTDNPGRAADAALELLAGPGHARRRRQASQELDSDDVNDEIELAISLVMVALMTACYLTVAMHAWFLFAVRKYGKYLKAKSGVSACVNTFIVQHMPAPVQYQVAALPQFAQAPPTYDKVDEK